MNKENVGVDFFNQFFIIEPLPYNVGNESTEVILDYLLQRTKRREQN
jgi:hypothetical protein